MTITNIIDFANHPFCSDGVFERSKCVISISFFPLPLPLRPRSGHIEGLDQTGVRMLLYSSHKMMVRTNNLYNHRRIWLTTEGNKKIKRMWTRSRGKSIALAVKINMDENKAIFCLYRFRCLLRKTPLSCALYSIYLPS